MPTWCMMAIFLTCWIFSLVRCKKNPSVKGGGGIVIHFKSAWKQLSNEPLGGSRGPVVLQNARWACRPRNTHCMDGHCSFVMGQTSFSLLQVHIHAAPQEVILCSLAGVLVSVRKIGLKSKCGCWRRGCGEGILQPLFVLSGLSQVKLTHSALSERVVFRIKGFCGASGSSTSKCLRIQQGPRQIANVPKSTQGIPNSPFQGLTEYGPQPPPHPQTTLSGQDQGNVVADPENAARWPNPRDTLRDILVSLREHTVCSVRGSDPTAPLVLARFCES